MNSLASLLLPAALGLIAGMTHGFVSHTMDLPESLAEQIASPLSAGGPSGFSDF